MTASNNNTHPVFNLPIVLTLIFLVLKLTGYIGWSWWWVMAPLWIPVAFYVLLFVAGVLIAVCVGGVKGVKGYKEQKRINQVWEEMSEGLSKPNNSNNN